MKSVQEYIRESIFKDTEDTLNNKDSIHFLWKPVLSKIFDINILSRPPHYDSETMQLDFKTLSEISLPSESGILKPLNIKKLILRKCELTGRVKIFDQNTLCPNIVCDYFWLVSTEIKNVKLQSTDPKTTNSFRGCKYFENVEIISSSSSAVEMTSWQYGYFPEFKNCHITFPHGQASKIYLGCYSLKYANERLKNLFEGDAIGMRIHDFTTNNTGLKTLLNYSINSTKTLKDYGLDINADVIKLEFEDMGIEFSRNGKSEIWKNMKRLLKLNDTYLKNKTTKDGYVVLMSVPDLSAYL